MALASLVVGWLASHGATGLAFAAIAVFPAALLIFARPERGLLLAILLMLLVPFTFAIGLRQAGLPRLAALAALVAVGVAVRKRAMSSERRTIVDLAILAYVAFGLASWQLGSHPPTSLRATVNYLTPFALYPAARRFARGRLDAILWVLLAGGALASLTVYYEFFITHQPLWADRASYYWTAQQGTIFRPGGVFGSPPGAGAVLAMTTLAGLPVAARAIGTQRVVAWSCIVASTGALILTFTRGALIGFGLGLLLYIALLGPAKWARAAFGSITLALLFFLLVLPRISGATWYQEGVLRQGTFASRQSFWSSSFPLISNSTRHLLIGHGINSLIIGRPDLPGTPDPDIALAPTLTRFGPHNQFIRTLLEEGVVGLALVLAWLVGPIVQAARWGWRSLDERPSLAACSGALAGFFVANTVGDAFRHPPSLAIAVVIAGVAVSRSQIARGREVAES